MDYAEWAEKQGRYSEVAEETLRRGQSLSAAQIAQQLADLRVIIFGTDMAFGWGYTDPPTSELWERWNRKDSDSA